MPRTTVMLLLIAMLALGVLSARAGEVPGTHGIAMHGDLKYPADFTYFDYVNPGATKGGTVRLHAVGTFDSFNSFIVRGNPAAGLGIIYVGLLDRQVS